MRLNTMKDLMLKVLNLALDKYNFKLIQFVILDNHFHFFIETVEKGPTISRIMQFIKSQYARRYNKLTNRIGPFWNERFGDTIIELCENPEFTFFWIYWYIGYNPVRKKRSIDPRDYKYSSINAYLIENYKPLANISFHKYFINLGTSFKERVNKLLKYEVMYRKRLFSEYLLN